MLLDSALPGTQEQQAPEAQGPVLQTAPQAVPQPQPITGKSLPAEQITPAITGGEGDKSVNQQPISDQSTQFKSGEQGEQVRANRWENWTAGWDLLSHSLPVGLPGADEIGALPRGYIRSQAQDYTDRSGLALLSPEEANKQYPGRPEPYTSPVSPIIAKMEFDDRERIKHIEAWKNSSKAPFGMDFAQGLIGGFADPLIMALTAAMGPLARVAGIPAETGLRGAAQVFEHNMALNLATGEVSRQEALSEGEKAPMLPMIGQAAEGAVGGTLFHFGLKGAGVVFEPAGKYLRDAWHSFIDTPAETRAQTVKEVVGAMEQNKTPNLDAQNRVMEERRAGAVQDGENVRRMTPPQDLPTQVFAAADANGPKKFNQSLGEGAQFTSSPDVANNAVSHPEGGEPGRIGQAYLDTRNLLDLNEPATGERERSFLKAVEEKSGVELPDGALEGASLKEIVEALHDAAGTDDIPADIDKMIQQTAKDMGIDGYKYLGQDSNGEPTAHIVHLFDENHPVEPAFEANPEHTPKITSDQQAALDQATRDPSRADLASPERDQEIHDMRHGDSINADPDYMTDIATQIEQDAKEQLKKLAEEDPHAKEELEKLQRDSAKQKQVGEMTKQLADCVTGELS